MTETENLIINKAFSLRIKNIGMITDLGQRIGGNDSAIVREAIEFYYKVLNHPAVDGKEAPLEVVLGALNRLLK